MVGDKQADEQEPIIDAIGDKFTASQDRSVSLACLLACLPRE